MTRTMDAILRRGFRPSKCLRFLKMSLERIKILQNKHEVILKQTRRDIGQLLVNSGQEANPQLLQSRVEVLVKEQNMLRAYDLIQQYCNLVANRINVVENHKECPADLKEAIAGLCYAAPRSAELRELQQIRDLFILKYGREFVVAAAELQTDCGVSTEIIEKLSSRKASPETTVALLKEIAAEYNTNWDSAENRSHLLVPPSPNLLAGPKAFSSASQLHTLSSKKNFKDSPPNSPLSRPIRTHSIDSNMKHSTETIPYVLHPNEEEEEEEKEGKEEEKEEKEAKEEEKEAKEEEKEEENEVKEEEEEEIIDAEENLPPSRDRYSLPKNANVSTELVTQEEQTHNRRNEERMPDQIYKPEEEAISVTTNTKADNFLTSLSPVASGEETLNLTKPVQKHHFYEKKSTTRMELDLSEDNVTIPEQNIHLRSNMHRNNSYAEEIQRPDFDDSSEEDGTSSGNIARKKNHQQNGNYRLNNAKEIQRPTFDNSTEEEEEDRSVRKAIHGQNGHLRLNKQNRFYTQESRRPTFDDGIEEDRTARRTAQGKNEHLRLNMQKNIYAQDRRRPTFDDNTEEEEEEDRTARRTAQGKEHLRLNMQKNFYAQERRKLIFDDNNEEEEEGRTARRTTEGKKEHLRLNMQKSIYAQERRRPTLDDNTEEEEEVDRTARRTTQGKNENLRLNMQKGIYVQERRRPTFDGNTEEEEEEDRNARRTSQGRNEHLRLNMQKNFYAQERRSPRFDVNTEEEEEYRTARRTTQGKNEHLRSNIQKSSYAQEIRRPTFDDNSEEEEEDRTARKAYHGRNGHHRLNIQKNFYTQEIRRPTFDNNIREEEEDRTARKVNHGQNGHLRVNTQKRFYSQEGRKPTFDDSTEEEEEEEEEDRTVRKANHGQNGHLRVNMQKSFYTQESRRPTFGGIAEQEEEEEEEEAEEEEEGYRYNNVHTRPKFVTRRRPVSTEYNEEVGIIKGGELVQETPSHARSRANNYYQELSPVEIIQRGAARTPQSSSEKDENRKLRGNSDHEYKMSSKKSGKSYKLMQESNYDYKHESLKDESAEVEKRNGEKEGYSQEAGRRKPVRSVRSHYMRSDDSKSPLKNGHPISPPPS